MKPVVHTVIFALVFACNLSQNNLFSQDKLSNWYIQEVFFLGDINQDKYLSGSEIMQLRENLAYYQNPENFGLTDKNADTYLDYAEFRYRFGQSLVHRLEIDGKELKVLSENYPYFENAAFKYLKRHPVLTAQLMNNLIWTREHPDLMKQIISDRAWLGKEKDIVESLSSNLIWLSENPGLAKKFYQSKYIRPVSDIWKSWSYTHLAYLAEHEVPKGIQIDFPYWPTEEETQAPGAGQHLVAKMPSPGALQKSIDSLEMANTSLHLSLREAQGEIQRRDSVAQALFAEQGIPTESTPPKKDIQSLQLENETLKTQVRQMRIEKRLARIEEDQLLATTIAQRKQIASFEKKQELSEEDGVLRIKDEADQTDKTPIYEAQLEEKERKIAEIKKELDQAKKESQIAQQSKASLALQLESFDQKLEKALGTKDSLSALLRQQGSQVATQEQEKERTWNRQLEELGAHNQRLQTETEQSKAQIAELQGTLERILEAKEEDTKEFRAIEEQYKQQILALDIELDKTKASLDTENTSLSAKKTSAELALAGANAQIETLNKRILRLEEQEKAYQTDLLNAQMAQQKVQTQGSQQIQESEKRWALQKDSLLTALNHMQQNLADARSSHDALQKRLLASETGQATQQVQLQNRWAREKDSLLIALAANQQNLAEAKTSQKTLQDRLEQVQQGQRQDHVRMQGKWNQEKDSLLSALSENQLDLAEAKSARDVLQERLLIAQQGQEMSQAHMQARWKQEKDSLLLELNKSSLSLDKLRLAAEENQKLADAHIAKVKEELDSQLEPSISSEYDELYMRVNELEYNNAKLKAELEATLNLANQRETILEKRLKSSLKESSKMAVKMRRFRQKNKGVQPPSSEMELTAMELAESRSKLKEMDELNRALLAQLQANNNYLGHNISQRDQIKQELIRLKSGLSKLELENDSLYAIIKRETYLGYRQDSMLTYQKRVSLLEQTISSNQAMSKQQIAHLTRELDSLENEISILEEDKITLARIHKVEASRSQKTNDREKRLSQLEQQLVEKELILQQKEKVIQDKIQELALKEKKYQDMQAWEEQLHLLERKLKIHPNNPQRKSDN